MVIFELLAIVTIACVDCDFLAVAGDGGWAVGGGRWLASARRGKRVSGKARPKQTTSYTGKTMKNPMIMYLCLQLFTLVPTLKHCTYNSCIR